MHDPHAPKPDDLKDKQRRHDEESRPLGEVERSRALGRPPPSKPLHRPESRPDLVKG